MTLSKTAYAILGMLSFEPLSGYGISQLMKESIGNFWTESDGQLYPALAKLTKEKLIRCKENKKENTRRKKIYAITKEGRSALTHWLQTKPEKSNVRNEALLKLFFGGNISSLISLEHLEAIKYETKALIAELTHTKNQLSSQDKNSPHYPYWIMSIDYGLTLAEAKLEWCNNAITKLNKLRGVC